MSKKSEQIFSYSKKFTTRYLQNSLIISIKKLLATTITMYEQ